MNKYIKKINTTNPYWIELWDSHNEVEFDSLRANSKEQVKIDQDSEQMDLSGAKYHVFETEECYTGKNNFEWLVYELPNGQFVSTTTDGMGDMLEAFSTLEEALKATISIWASETHDATFDKNSNTILRQEILVYE